MTPVRRSWIGSLAVVVFISGGLMGLCVMSSAMSHLQTTAAEVDLEKCLSSCSVQIVESIPEGLSFNTSLPAFSSTYQAWRELIDLAETEILQAGMYWTLRGSDIFPHPSAWQGEDIFSSLKNATLTRGLSLRIAQNKPRPGEPNLDTDDLAREAGAEVRSVDFPHLLGAGILHTKLWVVDSKHFYVGSANFDWRSLTQVKEVGVLVKDCPCLATDIEKIWSVYWRLGDTDTLPDSWPQELATRYNAEHPLSLSELSVYLSSSPAPLCPQGREVDIEAILATINSAQEFIHIAVMDYFPSTIYTKHPVFWPVIDDALRRAAIDRGVRVRLLGSHWAHTRPSMLRYLSSLEALSGHSSPKVDIQVKLFTVPSFTPDQAKIPFGRVNHNKYMVTDKTGFIGTSNWSGDYFISTGGIGFVFEGPLREQLNSIFERDWSSHYAQGIHQY